MEELEVLKLIKEAQNNNSEAKEKLINANFPLIKSVIKRYKEKGIEYDDLYQLGSLGFLKAINNFDESFNVKFSTYAVPMIAGEIKRFLRDNGIIKVSRSTKTFNIQINKFIEEYISKYDKSPCIDIIAKNFEVTSQDIVFAMESSRLPISLSNTVGGDDASSTQMLIEKIPENDMENDLDKMLIYNSIKKLCPRDKKIIILRYFRDKTQKEISLELGVSQVQISRLENKILNNLKTQIKEEKN